MTGSVCQTHAGRRLKSSWPRPETPSNCGWAPQRYAFSQKVGQKNGAGPENGNRLQAFFIQPSWEKRSRERRDTPIPGLHSRLPASGTKLHLFSFTGIIQARNFSKRGPKQADAKTFFQKSINCTSHIQKACESEKTTWKFRVPVPERNPWMKVFIGPKAKKRRFPASWHPFKGEFSSPRPEIQDLREFLGKDDKLHDFRKKSAQRG